MNAIRCTVIALVAVLAAGCASYGDMYSQYAALQAEACAAQRQPLVEFTDSGGNPIRVYEREQHCNIQAPDNPGRIAADVGKSLVGDAVKGLIGFKALDELGSTMRRGFDRAGDQVGGDGVIGGDNEDIFTDKTAPPPEPVIVDQPDPVVVEPDDGS